MDVVPTFEVCSPGDFRICERVGVPMERIVLSGVYKNCLLYTSPSPRDRTRSRMPSSA